VPGDIETCKHFTPWNMKCAQRLKTVVYSCGPGSRLNPYPKKPENDMTEKAAAINHYLSTTSTGDMNDAGDIDHVASAIFSVSKSYPSAGDMPATLRSEKVEFSIS
jgi:hypothetical protein